MSPAVEFIQPATAAPWSPDNGNGTFTNPVLYADYSDPDAIRVGDDYWLTASSFNQFPGLPILHSHDLVNWRLVNHAVKRLPFARFDQVQPGCGVWAPSIRHHDGKFWIFFPTPDEGIFVTTATDPAGEWSEPHLVKAGKGLIDPCPLWDDNGQAYLIHAWARSRSGKHSLLTLARMAPDGSNLLDDGVTVFEGAAHHPTIEGPKLYKRNGWYYIFAPAGGVATGWQTVLRSRKIEGPYEDKVVLAQGKTEINGPHQGAWVDTAGGADWFLHFQDKGIYGRIVHLQPMTWTNDWPVIGSDPDGDGKGEPVLQSKMPATRKPSSPSAPPASDEFASSRLGLQWQWQANPQPTWLSLTARDGWLRLFPQPWPTGKNLWLAPALLLQKFPAPQFTAVAKLDFSGLSVGEKAGLIVHGKDYSYLAIERTVKGFQLVRRNCAGAVDGKPETLVAESACAGNSLELRLQLSGDGQGRFSHRAPGGDWALLGEPFKVREGNWIGAKFGLFATTAEAVGGGLADFDFFHVLAER